MVVSQHYKKRYVQILDDGTGTGFSSAAFVGDSKEVELVLVGTTTSVATVKVVGGFSPVWGQSGATAVDFSSAGSKTNQWSYQHSRNRNDDSAITGTTGLSISANGVYRLLVNTNFIEWLGVEISAITSGKISAYVYAKV